MSQISPRSLNSSQHTPTSASNQRPLVANFSLATNESPPLISSPSTFVQPTPAVQTWPSTTSTTSSPKTRSLNSSGVLPTSPVGKKHPYAPISISNQTSSQQSPPTSSPAANQHSAQPPDELTMSKLEQEWQQPDMMQCMNQAVQARLSRSYSSNEHENRPSRHGSRRNYTDNTTTPIADVERAEEPRPVKPARTFVYSTDNVAQKEDASSRVREELSFRPAYSNKPPVPVRSKQTDIDSAIASSSSHISTSQYGRQPSRKIQYVNRRNYDEDPRRIARQQSHDSAVADYRPAAAVNERPSPQIHNRPPPALHSSQRSGSERIYRSTNEEGHSNLSSSWSSSQSQVSMYRYRFDSLGSDSHSSTEDRVPSRPPRHMRATPPSPAPRKLSLEPGLSRSYNGPTTGAPPLTPRTTVAGGNAQTLTVSQSALSQLQESLENGLPVNQT